MPPAAPAVPAAQVSAATAAPRPQLVIFDCDGVLVDSERLSHQVLREMLAEHGVVLEFDDTVRRFIGCSYSVGVERMAGLLGHEPGEAFLAELLRRTQLAFQASLTTVPGVVQLLDRLQASGPLPYCVASNGGHDKLRFTLGHTGLLPRFVGRIFSADDVAQPKPAPDLFLHAARALGALPQHTTVVEDTPTGVRAAKAAGMRAIGYCAMTAAALLHEAGADVLAPTMLAVQADLLGHELGG
jgi:HAD superfamily hydrolase (TIGR01509 family)